MKILMIMHTSLAPLISGAVRRNYHLAREAERGNDVRVLVLDPEHDPVSFRETWGDGAPPVETVDSGYYGWRRALADGTYALTGFRRGRRSGMVQQAIDRACSEYGPDLIHLSSPFLTRYAFPEGIPVVADAHNVEHDNVERIARIGPTVLRRAFGSALAARLRRDEPVMAARCHRILCVCERDREIFMRMVPRVPVVMVPNGVDLGHFTPTRTRREPQELIFVGTMNYPPNDEAVCWFVDRCLPLLIPRWPNIHLTVLGADPSAEVRRRASDRVRVRGRVGDIRPYLERAEVSIAPIHAGGGTRMKILEAMAMGIPVVSTPLGCEGLELADGMHLLMADSPEAFVQAVDRLLSDAILRVSLAVRARETVQARFGWDQIGHLLRCVYEGCGGIAHLQHRVEPEFVKEVTP